jgi:hypothetical protein
MTVNNKSLIIFQSLIFFNYLLYFYKTPESIYVFLSYLIILLFLYILFDEYRKKNYFFIFLITTCSIITLGSPVIDWDARSVWIMHAKQLFYSGDINVFFDDYQNIYWSHNDYPNLAATLSSTITKTLNHWNEIFPKFSSILLICTPLIFLFRLIKNCWQKIFLLLAVLFILEKRLINGEMDGILSIYFCYIIFIIFNYRIKNNSNKIIDHYFLIINCVIITLIKHEGVAALLSIILAIFIIDKLYKKKIFKFKTYIYFSISLIPILVWMYLVNQNNQSLHLQKMTDLTLFKDQIFNFSSILLIFNKLIINKGMVIGICIFLFFLKDYVKFYNNLKISHLFNYQALKVLMLIFTTILIYFSILFLVFLCGTYETLESFLSQYANRAILPIAFTLSYTGILISKTDLRKNN